MTAPHVRLDDLTVRDLLASIAAKTPTPGGGAVASLTGAIGAALARMVVNYSLGKKTLAAHDDLHQRSLQALSDMEAKFLALAEADAVAYARLNDLWKLDKADPKRLREFPAAVQTAIDAPAAVLDLSSELLTLLRQLAGTTNAMLKSDLAITAILADAAARAAAWNVRINLPLMDDDTARRQLESVVAATLKEARTVCDSIERECK